MGFNIIPTEIFKKEAKRLSKKFPSLKEELKELDRHYCFLANDTPLSSDNHFRTHDHFIKERFCVTHQIFRLFLLLIREALSHLD